MQTFTGRLATYDCTCDRWSHSIVSGTIECEYFASGALRSVHHCTINDSSGPMQRVAKVAHPDTNATTSTYYMDVKVQAIAAKCAQSYNLRPRIPKPIKFLEPALLILPKDTYIEVISPVGTIKSGIFHIEEMVAGDFVKHTNNMGYVNENDRNTPQAFSHYSYVWSNGTFLICDIQGISTGTNGLDIYTDPQMHMITTDSSKLKQCLGVSAKLNGGLGDFGAFGIDAFFTTHRCNAICHALRLELFSPTNNDDGTLPIETSQALSRNEEYCNISYQHSESAIEISNQRTQASMVFGARAVAISLLRGATEDQLLVLSDKKMNDRQPLHVIFQPNRVEMSHELPVEEKENHQTSDHQTILIDKLTECKPSFYEIILEWFSNIFPDKTQPEVIQDSCYDLEKDIDC